MTEFVIITWFRACLRSNWELRRSYRSNWNQFERNPLRKTKYLLLLSLKRVSPAFRPGS